MMIESILIKGERTGGYYSYYFTKKHVLWVLIGKVAMKHFQQAPHEVFSCRN